MIFSMVFILTGCNSDLKASVESLQSEVTQSQSALDEKSNEITELKQQIKDLENLLDEKDDQIIELEENSSETLEQELLDTKQQLVEKDKEIRSLQSEIKELLPYKETVTAAQEEQKEAAENRDSPIVIEITDFGAGASNVLMRVEGELKNISDLTLRSIELRATFKDANGNIIDSSTSYAGSGGLQPNALTKFSTSVRYDARIENVLVELVNYRTE